MARKYAAIMALIGMVVVLLRALKDNASFDAAMTSALVWTTILGVVGMLIGSIAEKTVVESVRLRLENELTRRQQESMQPPSAESVSAQATA